MKEQIILEINGVEINAEVEFDYTPPVKGRTYGLPENCWPDEPEIFDINDLMLEDNSDCFAVDVSGLIDYISDDIIEQLKELNNESR